MSVRSGLAVLAGRWRYRLLLGLLVAFLLMQPLLADRAFGEAAAAVHFLVICVATVAVTRSASVHPGLGVGLALVWLALFGLGRLGEGVLVTGGLLVGTLAVSGMLVWITLEALVREAKADGDALAGAVFGYLLLAVVWAQIYASILLWDPAAFAGPAERLGLPEMIYFSLVTITTLGYGDVLPVGRFARIVAGVEAAVGTLYIAVLIGRLVSAFRPARQHGGDSGDAAAARED